MGAGRKNETLYLAIDPVGDRFIEHGPEATVGGLIASLQGQTTDQIGAVRVERTGRLLSPSLRLTEADLRSGDELQLVDPGSAEPPTDDEAQREPPEEDAEPEQDLDHEADHDGECPTSPAALRFLSGPLLGQAFDLTLGDNTVGRMSSNDVAILDPGVSRTHAVITVSPTSVTITDQGSTNGITIDGRRIAEPTLVRPGQQMALGHSWVTIDHRPQPADVERPPRPRAQAAGPLSPAPSRPANRYQGLTITLPTPPDPGMKRKRTEFLSPGRGQHRLAIDQFHAAAEAVEARLRVGAGQELSARLQEAPSVSELVSDAGTGARLWERRARDLDGLQARLGRGPMPSRTTIEVPIGGTPELRATLASISERFRTLDDAPAVADLKRLGSLGLSGRAADVHGLASAIVVQLAWLHGPDQLGIACRPGPGLERWDWLKWLPHVDFAGSHNGVGDGAFVAWVAALLDGASPSSALAAAPTGTVEAGDSPGRRRPRPEVVVLVLDGDSTLPTALLARLLQEGPALGVFTLLLGQDAADGGLPVGATIAVGPGSAALERGFGHPEIEISAERLDPDSATAVARLLTPVRYRGDDRWGKLGVSGSPLADDGVTVGEFQLGLVDPLPAEEEPPDDAVTVTPEPVDAADGEPAPPRLPSRATEPAPKPRDLKSLPHGDDDSRLILGTVHRNGQGGAGVFACNLGRDGSLAITGDRGCGKTSALRSVAAAVALLRVDPVRIPMTYYLDVGGDLEGIGVLPHTVGASRHDLDGYRRVVTDLERLLTDRASGFAQAHVETFADFRRLAPQSSLRRALVLVDDVDGFVQLLDSIQPGRAVTLLDQLAEHGTRFGIHLVISAESRDSVEPSLGRRIGRWLHLGSVEHGGRPQPGTASVGRSEVRFAPIGGARASHRALVELAHQLEGRGVTAHSG